VTAQVSNRDADTSDVAEPHHDGSEVSGLYVAAVLSFVRRACGDEGVDQLCREADERLDDLPDDSGWISLDRMHRLVDAAERVTGLPDLGRPIGEEIFEQGLRFGYDQMMRAAGGPAEAISMLVAVGSRLAGGWTLEVTDQSSEHMVIESRTPLGISQTFWCGTGIGYYSLVPGVFGVRGAATHPRCLGRGDDSCEYVVRWDPSELRTTGPSHDAVAHVEKLQATAARLATAPDPASVVELAAELATSVNIGRHFLIVADLGGARSRVVGHHGFDDLDAVDLMIDRIEHGDGEDDPDAPKVCMSRLAAATADYGWIASVLPPRSTIDALVERPLQAFAHHIASAIDAALLLETAQRDRDTARALVAFAHDLAGATELDQVADLVESALLGSTGCAAVRVWLHDRDDQAFRQVGSSIGVAGGVAHQTPFDVESTITLVSDRATLDRFQFATSDVGCASIAPLAVRGELVGCVAVGWPSATPPGAGELERVEGIADQAALAFDVVALLADLQRQARHDALSGLANRSLLAERAELAMAQAGRTGNRVGLLFIDLDHFKSVNDEYGHAAGDQVICEVADRLLSVVRAHDTVCRLGGDEFVVLITECTGDEDAAAAARRVCEVMTAPFVIAGTERVVSATVGVLSASPDECTWHALLDRADAAMYRGKQQGRAGIVVG
jgi:diguanylate cyclase (GGDEF)-like protein